jgi:hypothetical protein
MVKQASVPCRSDFSERRRRSSSSSLKPQSRVSAVTVRVLVMLDLYFVSVKYVFVCIKLICVYVKLLKI